jgi:tRNA pseudouridine38-40 synthase
MSEENEVTNHRYAFEINYFGKPYVGWQIQPNGQSIEAEIELRLSRLHSNIPIKIVGCGRTDAGVHAFHYVFHVDLPPILSENQFIYKLNKMLSQNITVKTITKVNDNFHARFNAKSRTYRYFLNAKKNPFIQESSFYFPYDLDIEAMNLAANNLIGTKDFECFSKTITNQNTTSICTVVKAEWFENELGIYFEITADRFLRNMVRAIVGTLIDIGLGINSIDSINNVLKSKSRENAGKSVASHGLFLWKIEY